MSFAGLLLIIFGGISLLDENVKVDFGWAYAFGAIALGAGLIVMNRLTGGGGPDE